MIDVSYKRSVPCYNSVKAFTRAITFIEIHMQTWFTDKYCWEEANKHVPVAIVNRP